jgi:hypothetical protein
VHIQHLRSNNDCQPCKSPSVYPRIEDVGVGYDVTTMQKKERSVLKYCCNKDKKTEDGKYRIPDGISQEPDRQSNCQS